MNGNVKFFNSQKGFGFIAGEDGKEYFVHQSDIGEGVELNDKKLSTFKLRLSAYECDASWTIFNTLLSINETVGWTIPISRV